MQVQSFLTMIVAACAFAVFPVSTSIAEETAKHTNDPIGRLSANTGELLNGLDEEGLKFVYSTRMRDGVIRATHYIQGMVSGAVEACSKAQPDMEKPLRERYSRWWGAVEPPLKEAEAHTKKTIAEQKLVAPDKIIEHLNLVKEAADFSQSKVEKQYVTDRDACQYLLDNMDVTERTLTSQLKDTLSAIPLPEPEVKGNDAAGASKQGE